MHALQVALGLDTGVGKTRQFVAPRHGLRGGAPETWHQRRFTSTGRHE